jgi:hypothetical protein
MSTLSVNTITAETGNTVSIASGKTLDASQGFTPPVGHVLQIVDSGLTTTNTTINAGNASGLASVSLVKKSTNSRFIIQVQSAVTRPGTSGWFRMGATATGGFSFVQDLKDATTWHTQNILIKTDSISGAIGDTITFNSYHSNATSQNDAVKNVRVTVTELAQ